MPGRWIRRIHVRNNPSRAGKKCRERNRYTGHVGNSLAHECNLVSLLGLLRLVEQAGLRGPLTYRPRGSLRMRALPALTLQWAEYCMALASLFCLTRFRCLGCFDWWSRLLHLQASRLSPHGDTASIRASMGGHRGHSRSMRRRLACRSRLRCEFSPGRCGPTRRRCRPPLPNRRSRFAPAPYARP